MVNGLLWLTSHLDGAEMALGGWEFPRVSNVTVYRQNSVVPTSAMWHKVYEAIKQVLVGEKV